MYDMNMIFNGIDLVLDAAAIGFIITAFKLKFKFQKEAGPTYPYVTQEAPATEQPQGAAQPAAPVAAPPVEQPLPTQTPAATEQIKSPEIKPKKHSAKKQNQIDLLEAELERVRLL